MAINIPIDQNLKKILIEESMKEEGGVMTQKGLKWIGRKIAVFFKQTQGC